MKVGGLGTLCMAILLMALAVAQSGSRLEPIVVEAEGVAVLRLPREQAVREATRNALQQAIESGCGVRLARLEVGRDGALQCEAQLTFAQGVVLRWQRLGEPRIAEGCIYVRVRAEVVPLMQLQTPADWREVWQTVGHPPLVLHIRFLGEPAMELHARNALKAALIETLHEMGVRLSSQRSADSWQLIAEIQLEAVKRWGDMDAPYGLGDLFASWQVRLLLQIAPPSTVHGVGSGSAASPVLILRREAKAVSFTGDREAVQCAVRKAVCEPDTDWRITLAALWIDQILGLFERSDRSDKASGSKKKEARNHAKSDANKSVAPARGKRAATRSARR